MGNKTLELRPSSVDKASAARALLKDVGPKAEVDFILCLGDGKTDEAVFTFLEQEYGAGGAAAGGDEEGTGAGTGSGEMSGEKGTVVLTSTVGKKQTEASYFVEGVQEVEAVLSGLASLC